jgi:predicted DNA-binding ribbon-helix-helix protein
VKSRRIVINGHPTSLRLEPEFWYWLREIGAECGISATKLIAAINTARNPDRSLSSAIRVAVAGLLSQCGLRKYFTGKSCKYGHVAERWLGRRSRDR